MVQTFKKEERLTGKQSFESLFQSGKSFTSLPFRVVWAERPSHRHFPVRLGISVPKRLFAGAVQRNKLKRRIREAYRKNKHRLYEVLEAKHLHIDLMVIYIAKTELSSALTEEKMAICLQKIVAKLQ